MASKQTSRFFTNPEVSDIALYRNIETMYISEGGYGKLSTCVKDGKRYVLKSLKSEHIGDNIFETLLRKEFEIGYNLDHQNICRTVAFEEIGELGNTIVLEYVDGVTLEQFAGRSHISSVVINNIIQQLCDALYYIHSKQVVHRDLKPQNILITHNGANVKLIDFGFSDTDHHAVLKNPAGTLAYAAPEQIDGATVDNRSDIFSLGAIVTEAFGRQLTAHQREIFRRCQNLDPERRYSDCIELKSDFSSKPSRSKWPIFVALSLLLLLGFALFQIRGVESVPQQIDTANSDTIPIDTKTAPIVTALTATAPIATATQSTKNTPNPTKASQVEKSITTTQKRVPTAVMKEPQVYSSGQFTVETPEDLRNEKILRSTNKSATTSNSSSKTNNRVHIPKNVEAKLGPRETKSQTTDVAAKPKVQEPIEEITAETIKKIKVNIHYNRVLQTDIIKKPSGLQYSMDSLTMASILERDSITYNKYIERLHTVQILIIFDFTTIINKFNITAFNFSVLKSDSDFTKDSIALRRELNDKIARDFMLAPKCYHVDLASKWVDYNVNMACANARLHFEKYVPQIADAYFVESKGPIADSLRATVEYPISRADSISMAHTWVNILRRKKGIPEIDF
ncbi:MAG: serine/threonine-protein kinase [Rikenellaceae bacterium]